jgi:hypothetical protein
MAITQVANPSSVPSAVADYEAQNAHISAFNNLANNQAFILTNSGGTGLPAIKLGTYIQYGGNLYVVDTEDYAILGTPVDGNNYIRLSGSTTLTAEWVQTISSYVWNEVYGYKYTGSYALLPYLVVKSGTEYEKYSMALDASFGKLKATTLDTGQGANELYAMNQNLRTTDSPTFTQITTTSGPNKPVNNNDSTPPSIGVGGFTFAKNSGTTAAGAAITLPTGGTYLVVNSANNTSLGGGVSQVYIRAGGSTVQGLPYAANDYRVNAGIWRIE